MPRETASLKDTMDMVEADSRIHAWAGAKALPAAYLEKWLALDARARALLLEAAEQLRFRTGQFITVFVLLEEIAVRERQSMAEILELPSVYDAINSSGSAPGRARALIEELRTLRYPKLRQSRRRLEATITALKLPAGIKIALPRELASDEVRIEIAARGGAEMQELLAALIARTEGLVQLAAMLGGVDDSSRFDPD
jgi:hypothetical protein